jgi:hypothetical protein
MQQATAVSVIISLDMLHVVHSHSVSPFKSISVLVHRRAASRNDTLGDSTSVTPYARPAGKAT